jgi:hypothetical protein
VYPQTRVTPASLDVSPLSDKHARGRDQKSKLAQGRRIENTLGGLRDAKKALLLTAFGLFRGYTIPASKPPCPNCVGMAGLRDFVK